MSTLTELVDTHLPAARTRYADAVTELLAARADLDGIERLLENKTPTVARGFGAGPDMATLRHRFAAPNVVGNWGDLSDAALATRNASFGTADPE
jgi:hypothetical protein